LQYARVQFSCGHPGCFLNLRTQKEIERMTLLHVPVIDLTSYREGTPEGKAAVAEQIGQACRDIGFLVVSGHGIPENLIARPMTSPRNSSSFRTRKK
jgi:hypothetical protein